MPSTKSPIPPHKDCNLYPESLTRSGGRGTELIPSPAASITSPRHHHAFLSNREKLSEKLDIGSKAERNSSMSHDKDIFDVPSSHESGEASEIRHPAKCGKQKLGRRNGGYYGHQYLSTKSSYQEHLATSSALFGEHKSNLRNARLFFESGPSSRTRLVDRLTGPAQTPAHKLSNSDADPDGMSVSNPITYKIANKKRKWEPEFDNTSQERRAPSTTTYSQERSFIEDFVPLDVSLQRPLDSFSVKDNILNGSNRGQFENSYNLSLDSPEYNGHVRNIYELRRAGENARFKSTPYSVFDC